MALTSEQKTAIRVLIGLPGWESSESKLENAFALINENQALETLVIQQLTHIEAIDAQMTALLSIVDLDKAEESKVRESREAKLREMARQAVKRLASMCGLPVFSDIFATGTMGFSLPMS
jgi:inorganic triphosphatase YgiF